LDREINQGLRKIHRSKQPGVAAMDGTERRDHPVSSRQRETKARKNEEAGSLRPPLSLIKKSLAAFAPADANGLQICQDSRSEFDMCLRSSAG